MNETVLRVVRPSVIRFVLPIGFYGVLLIAASFTAYPLLQQKQWGPIVIGVFIAGSVLGLFKSLYVYRRNMSIITNKRIVDIEQPRLLERRVTECQLEQIRDVRYNTQGIVSLFDIGTVLIDFGNERGYLACRTVRHPRELQQFILTARQHHTKYSQSIQDEEL